MFKRKRQPEREWSFSSARRDLIDIRSQLSQAYVVFNTTADPDVVESSIFEIRALQAKYSRMLRDLKHWNEA